MAESFPPQSSLPRPLLPPRSTPYKAGTMVTGWNRGRVLFGFPTHHRDHVFLLTGEPRRYKHANAGYIQHAVCLFDMEDFPNVDGEWLQVRPEAEELEQFREKVNKTAVRLLDLAHRLEEQT